MGSLPPRPPPELSAVSYERPRVALRVTESHEHSRREAAVLGPSRLRDLRRPTPDHSELQIRPQVLRVAEIHVLHSRLTLFRVHMEENPDAAW